MVLNADLNAPANVFTIKVTNGFILSHTAFIPFQILFNIGLIAFQTAATADFMSFHAFIQKFLNADDLFHNTTKAATNAVITIIIFAIGFKFITKLRAFCATLKSFVAAVCNPVFIVAITT